MATTVRKSVCSVEHAGALDISIRKLFQNPRKILKPFVKEGMTAADIGCGPGFFTIEMAKIVGHYGTVTAVDLQEGMLKIVRRKTENTNLRNTVEFHNCQADNIGLAKTFDFILVFYMLHEVPDQKAFLTELNTIIKPAGKILIVEPKFHVRKSDFANSELIMQKAGFNVLAGPDVFFSRSVVLEKMQLWNA
jgi:ubiquinone/menaquinone biosynthesis C-methylase UbiE